MAEVDKWMEGALYGQFALHSTFTFCFLPVEVVRSRCSVISATDFLQLLPCSPSAMIHSPDWFQKTDWVTVCVCSRDKQAIQSCQINFLRANYLYPCSGF